MIEILRLPAASIRIVALETVGRKIFVVRICCTYKILSMTTNAIIAYRIKPERIIRLMTVYTKQTLMRTNQREAIRLMQLWNIKNQPVISIVTSDTISTYSGLMYIRMTRNTIRWRGFENQSAVTSLTIYFKMSSSKWEGSRVMIEMKGI